MGHGTTSIYIKENGREFNLSISREEIQIRILFPSRSCFQQKTIVVPALLAVGIHSGARKCLDSSKYHLTMEDHRFTMLVTYQMFLFPRQRFPVKSGHLIDELLLQHLFVLFLFSVFHRPLSVLTVFLPLQKVMGAISSNLEKLS